MVRTQTSFKEARGNMKRQTATRVNPSDANGRPVKSAVAAAVFLAIYGFPNVTRAQSAPQPEQAPANVPALEEVTVTANRREQTLEAVPYNMSVVSADQLAQANVTDLASLSSTVPGLSMFDYGARFTAASAPIIRGINATAEATRGFRTFEQNPVGTYIGNSPIDGYFQLDDLKQVEVLRGPQGTLYGAGALGGALRLIPNSPDTKAFAGTVEVSGDRLDHSNGTGYTARGMINVPLADTLAFRASAKYNYQPGFVDVNGLLQRTNNGLSGLPILANPADPVGSSGVYYSHEDWNYQRTFTGRASLLWKPFEAFSAQLAFLHSNARGDGGPVVNPDYPGGISPFDPNVTLPAGGRYREFSQTDQPWSRNTNLTSLDASYDAGFATLSSTSSYYTTSGGAIQDNTYDLAGIDSGAFLPYYAGTPTNPRFIYAQEFSDHAHTFSEELRLVSNSSPDRILDYVLGVFYEKQTRVGAWTIAIPGSSERAALLPCAPACDILVGPGDVNFQQIDTQKFEDRSVFGELTWHFLRHAQLTVGIRHFSQKFTDAQSYVDYTFPTDIPATPHESPASKTVGKVDPSYEYAPGHFVYALWSEGFRRGGANSVPLSGPFQESPALATYQPDKTNNYEGGFKGRFPNGLSYTVDVFYISWDKPQISSSLPSGNLAVYNANTAASKGFEIESSGPLAFVKGLSYSVGYSYVDAKLTSDFSLPANEGGVITPGALKGSNGEQMPGSPKNSLSAALLYDTILTPGYDMTLSLNGVYRSAVKMQLAPTLGSATVLQSSSYGILNASAAVTHQGWRVTAYVTNLLDKQEVLVPPNQGTPANNLGMLANDYVVNPPRETGVRIAYSF
jgi:outer membrane receptor protein involved in Fe transport